MADAAGDLGAALPAPGPPGAAADPSCGGWRALDVTVKGSIAESIGRALPADGSEVSAHLGRIFMWDLDLRRDVLPGDRIRLLWRRGLTGDVEVGAAHYEARALGKPLAAWRFQTAGDLAPSYWDDEGVEVCRRLKASPLDKYEQITALLKDRPTHAGMDFKTPVGTEIVAPRAGTVTRIDWKLRGNGRCLEVRFDDGTLAKFLHLSAVKVGRGARVRAGQVIALTGNTGRSTAPHLHYQLNRGARVVDPVDYHGVARRRLPQDELGAFGAEMARFRQSCAGWAP